MCIYIPRCTGNLEAGGKELKQAVSNEDAENALDNEREIRPIEATRKIIDRQPKIMLGDY